MERSDDDYVKFGLKLKAIKEAGTFRYDPKPEISVVLYIDFKARKLINRIEIARDMDAYYTVVETGTESI